MHDGLIKVKEDEKVIQVSVEKTVKEALLVRAVFVAQLVLKVCVVSVVQLAQLV
jgi:hypothetical protein